jgi:hypothetical protein
MAHVLTSGYEGGAVGQPTGDGTMGDDSESDADEEDAKLRKQKETEFAAIEAKAVKEPPVEAAATSNAAYTCGKFIWDGMELGPDTDDLDLTGPFRHCSASRAHRFPLGLRLRLLYLSRPSSTRLF